MHSFDATCDPKTSDPAAKFGGFGHALVGSADGGAVGPVVVGKALLDAAALDAQALDGLPPGWRAPG